MAKVMVDHHDGIYKWNYDDNGGANDVGATSIEWMWISYEATHSLFTMKLVPEVNTFDAKWEDCSL